MCEGQSLDLHFESRAAPSTLPDYHRMIACKTAQLFDASCRLGAHAAGCGDAAIAALRRLGRAYGMAFQIRDDVAGIWSSVDETGKTAGRRHRAPEVDVSGRVGDRAAAVRGARDRRRRVCPRRSLDAAEVERVVAALDASRRARGGRRCGRRTLAVIERHPNRELREFLAGTLDLAAAR